MAQSKNNIITHGLSGKLGNILVFSQMHGKTIVSKVSVPKHIDLHNKLINAILAP